MTVLEGKVDGIRTVFAERTDGHFTGGLAFRVGWADENLAVRGLTHTVAHLALSGVAGGEVHRHLDARATTTTFRAQGTAASVARLLGGVCAALGALPTHLLDREREAVLAEGAGAQGPVALDALYRYGARGHGLLAYPETGVPGLDADLVRIWAKEAFTRGNAVLWLSGDGMPETLGLSLPPGARLPVPPVTRGVAVTPAWYRSPTPEFLTVSGVVPSSPAVSVFTELLDRSLRAELCGPERLSRSAGATCATVDAQTTVVTVSADSLRESADGLAGGFVDVLSRLRWGALEDRDLAAVVRDLTESTARPVADHETVATRAVDALLGLRHRTPEELATSYAAVTTEEVRSCAEALASTAIAGTVGRGLGWAGWSAAPVDSPREVTGTSYPGREGHAGTLVVGDDGVSVSGGGVVTTVLYDDLVLMIRFADGGRHLVGGDGFQVDVEPTLYPVDGAAIARIDDAVDLARVVRIQARPAEDVPRPVRPPQPAQEGSAPPDGTPPSAPVAGAGWRSRIARTGRRDRS